MSTKHTPTRLDVRLASDLLANVDNFLFDFDGVICSHRVPINGSVECINRLKELGKSCYVVSNNSTITRKEFAQLLAGIGIKDMNEKSIVCPSWVLAGYLKSIDFRDKCYVIGTPSIAQELDENQIKHTGIGSNLNDYPDPANINYHYLKVDPDVKCVVVAFDYYFNYPKLVEATTYIHRSKDCLFLATHDDPLYSSANARVVIPGTGTMVSAVATSAGYRPLVLGKPYASMWNILRMAENLDAQRTCMIGDNLFTDIAFANNNSLGYSLAVLTGVTNEKEIAKYHGSPNLDDSKLVPKLYTDSLAKLHELLNETQ